MVDFNRFGTYGTANELEVRAAHLRAEVEANRFWYNLVTLAIPRFASTEDAERISLFINRRMTRTRRMEVEIDWIETLLRKTPADQRFPADAAKATLRAIVPPPPSTSYDFGRNAILFCVSAWIFSAREAFGTSGPGAIVLMLAMLGAFFAGVHLIFAGLVWIGECIGARRDMQAIRSMSEAELLYWFRATRVAQVRAAAERAPLPTLGK